MTLARRAALSFVPLLVMLGAPRASATPLEYLRGDDDVSPAAIRSSVDKGLEWLIANQELDGSWNFGDAPRVGCTSLILYTLLKSGLSPNHHACQRAVVHLQGEPFPTRTYDAAVLTIALSAHDRAAHLDWIQELADQLVEWQEDGDWGYPGGGDLSNTQYAALGLWAAARAGADIPQRTWFELVKAVFRYQAPDGGFGYKPDPSKSTGSMTAAGLGVLAICRDLIDLSDRTERKQAKKIDQYIDAGTAWLAERFTVEQNPGAGRSNLGYYIYGLERAGALLQTKEFGGHDWYAEASEFLVKGQNPAGHWGGSLGAGHPQTCFAMLVLRKATAPATGEQSKLAGSRYVQKNSEAEVLITASGDNPLSMWISGFGNDAKERLEWPKEAGQGPRVSRVMWLLDGLEVERLLGDTEAPIGHQRFAYQHSFSNPGQHQIVAEVHVMAPPRSDSSGRTYPATLKILRSDPIEAEVTNACPAWLLENARDRRRNLLPAARPQVAASSSSGGNSPQYVIDNKQGTSWLGAADDDSPTLSFSFARPVEVNVVVLGHARSTPIQPERWGRALEVEVTINGKDRHKVRMHSDVRRKSRLLLPYPVDLARLDLVIRWKVPGEHDQRATGFAEVELQMREELAPGSRDE